jgi:hypothetical protein
VLYEKPIVLTRAQVEPKSLDFQSPLAPVAYTTEWFEGATATV